MSHQIYNYSTPTNSSMMQPSSMSSQYQNPQQQQQQQQHLQSSMTMSQLNSTMVGGGGLGGAQTNRFPFGYTASPSPSPVHIHSPPTGAVQFTNSVPATPNTSSVYGVQQPQQPQQQYVPTQSPFSIQPTDQMYPTLDTPLQTNTSMITPSLYPQLPSNTSGSGSSSMIPNTYSDASTDMGLGTGFISTIPLSNTSNLQQQQQQPTPSTSLLTGSTFVPGSARKELSTYKTTYSSNDLTRFDKEEELKSIFTSSVSLVDDMVANMETTIQDPTKPSSIRPVIGFNYFDSNNPAWSTMVLEKHIPFPQEITHRYLSANTRTSQGVFPEIGRVWITIDQTLYLWDYRDNGDLITNNLSQIITTCQLVQPKKNVFKDSVQKILVVTTHVEIFLFALSFTGEKFEVIATPLVIPTDSIFINDIIGTENGRIFLAGQDGNLYEVVYGDEARSWFSSTKIYKVSRTTSIWNHLWTTKKPEIIQLSYDNQRKIIFTLNSDSVIGRYYLGNTGDQFTIGDSIEPLKTYQSNELNSILSIHTTHQQDYSLIAIVSNGVRLYISNDVKYARKPPLLLGDSIPHYTFYSNGVFFMSGESTEHWDKLVGTTPFTKKLIKRLYEVDDRRFITTSNEDPLEERPNLFSIKGRVNVIKEDIVNTIENESIFYKEFMIEQGSNPRRFLCLNSIGLHIITKLRYVDVFQNILSTNSFIDIDNFYNEFGSIFTNSLCIALYCMSPQSSILLNGVQYGSSVPKTTLPGILENAISNFKRKSGKPTFRSIAPLYTQDMGTSVNRLELVYSHAHNAVVAYLSQVLAPIWNVQLVALNGQFQLNSLQLVSIQSHLTNLLLFLDQSLLLTKNDIDIPIITKQINEQSTEDDAYKNEKRSLIGLKKIIQKSLQVINLFILLLNHNFKQIYDSIGLKEEDKKKIHDIKFKDYVLDQSILTLINHSSTSTYDLTEQVNVASLFISSFMSLLNQLNLPIDEVTQQLDFECPDLFKKKDKLLIVAKDKLHAALRDGKNPQSEQLVKEALLILDEICPSFDLHEMIGYLVTLSFYQFVVPLTQRYVQQLPQTSSIAQDQDKKKRFYEEIYIVINQLMSGEQLPLVDGKNIIDFMIGQIVLSDDKICHDMLYSWFLNNNFKNRLVEQNTPFIADFLFEHDIDLCWRYLVKNEKIIEASNVLVTMADNAKELNEKIKCYSNCKILLNQHKDAENYILAVNKLIICNVQKRIIKGLEVILSKTNDNNSDINQSILNLNQNIYDMTVLFNDYARKYLLHEVMLYLVHIGRHDDEHFVKLLWKIIIDKCKEASDGGRDTNQLIETLKSKIVSIGFELYPNEATFPIQNIIEWSEDLVFSCTVIPTYTAGSSSSPIQPFHHQKLWLVNSLHNQLNIDYWNIIDLYKTIIDQIDHHFNLNDQQQQYGGLDNDQIKELKTSYYIDILITLLEQINLVGSGSVIGSTTAAPSSSTLTIDRQLFQAKGLLKTLKHYQERLKQQHGSGGKNTNALITRITQIIELNK